MGNQAVGPAKESATADVEVTPAPAAKPAVAPDRSSQGGPGNAERTKAAMAGQDSPPVPAEFGNAATASAAAAGRTGAAAASQAPWAGPGGMGNAATARAATAGAGPATRPYVNFSSDPDVFVFAGTATREEIAATLFGDSQLTSRFVFVPAPAETTVEGVFGRGVRPRMPGELTQEAMSRMRSVLDGALADDVRRTVGLLSQGWIGDTSQAALAELCLRWSQRSGIPTPGGGSYFDAYLGALARQRLSQPHWYTLGQTETSRTALEWLISETGDKSEQITKAIELRSSAFRGTTGYTVSDVSPVLERGAVVGRFYYGDHDSTQILIVSAVGVASDEADADRLARQAVADASALGELGIGAIVPGGGGFTVYRAELSLLPGADNPVGEQGGRFYGYLRGTRFVTGHLLWAEATQAQAPREVAAQPGDWRTDLITMGALAAQVRQSAAGGALPADFVVAWQAADLAMIAVSGRLAAHEPADANRSAAAPVRAFFERARELVASLDTLRRYTTNEAPGPLVRENPYFSEDRYQWVIQRLDTAATPAGWRQALQDYSDVTAGMDGYLAKRLRERGDRAAAERLEYAGGITRGLDALILDHPTGQRIRATFYPQDDLAAGAGGAAPLPAQSVTCLFYAYREGTSWFLVDLTTPRQEKVTSRAGGTEELPPLELFEKLNTRLRFPKGRLYWQMPDGSLRELITTEPWSVSDWLNWAGLRLAVAGLVAVATLGAGLPATLMIVGGALLGAAAAGTDIWEKSEAGVLTATDVLIDVVSIVGSLAAAGSAATGSIIASSALKTGSAARLATFLDARVYLPLIGTILVTDTVQFVVMTAAALEEYQEVMATGDEAARDLAGKRLVAQLLVTGGITLLALKGNIADFRRGRNLYLDVDLGREAIARPLLSEAELNAMLRGRPGISNPDELARLLARSDIDREMALRIRADITQALTGGQITPESLQRVLSAMRRGENLDQVQQALAELRQANRAALAKAVAAGSQVHLGVRKGAEVDLGHGRKVTIEDVDEVDLLYLGTDGKLHMDEVKHTAKALRDKLQANPRQLENLGRWQSKDPGNRVVRVAIDTDERWTELFPTGVMKTMSKAGVPLDIAGRSWSPAKMDEIWAATEAKARQMNMWPPKAEFFGQMSTLDQAERFLGIPLR